MPSPKLRLLGLAAVLITGAILLDASPLIAAPPRWTVLGPFGGWVNHLTADPSAPRTLYAVAGPQGVFKTTDAGATWFPLLAADATSNVAVDPTRPATLYVTTNFSHALKSTDGGVHWIESSRGLDLRFLLSRVAVDPKVSKRVYVASDGVWHSIDGGASWQPARRPVPAGLARRITALVAVRRPAGGVYAGTAAGVFKSVDGGLTWTSASRGLAAGEVMALAVAPSNPRTLWASVRDAGIFRSTDGGSSWRPTASQPTGFRLVTALAVSPRAPFALWAGTAANGAAVSIDGGAHWTPAGPSASASVRSLAFAGDATLFAGLAPQGTEPNGIFATQNGGASWQARNRGFANLGGRDLAIDPRDSQVLWAAMGDQGLFRSDDGGREWQPIAGPPSPPSALLPPLISHVALSADGADLYVIENYALWTLGADGAWRPLGGSGVVPTSLFFLQADARDPAKLYTGNLGTLVLSQDRGASWTNIWPGFTCSFVALAVAPSQPATLYAGGSHNTALPPCRFSVRAALSRSTDGGATWTAADGGLPSTVVGIVTAVAVDPFDPRSLYAAVNPGFGVWKSQDGGNSWSRVGPAPSMDAVTALVTSPADGSVWTSVRTSTAGPIEVFVSRDGGATWRSTGGPQTYTIDRLVPDPDDPGRLYAVTWGGVWLGEADKR